MLEFLKAPFLVLQFSYYSRNNLPNDVICDIVIYVDDSTFCDKCDRASDLRQQLELTAEYKSDLWDTVNWGMKWLVCFNARKTYLVSFEWSSNTFAIDVKIYGSVLEEKSSFKMLGLTFSSKLDWGFYIISIAKTTSKPWFVLWSFVVPRLVCISKSTIHPCMEYCCQVWAGVPSCYLEL